MRGLPGFCAQHRLSGRHRPDRYDRAYDCQPAGTYARELEAQRLYEESIRLAHQNGFLQNEAVANEVAARFYPGRGFEKIARAYLRDARYCYLRWGADGKVRQFDELYPHAREQQPAPGSTSTTVAPVEHLDLATVIRVSQAVSSEIVVEKLIDTLMRTAIEHAGAQRAVLLLTRGAEHQVEAEATTNGDSVVVHQRKGPIAATALPASRAPSSSGSLT